jgi:hypothetical protein
VEGTLNAIVKSGGIEVPYCAYNEYVACELGRRLGAPIATGALTRTGNTVSFASLEVQLVGVRLRNIPKNRISEAVDKFPDECSRLFVFDHFIGNWDRAQNIKVSAIGSSLFCFAAFDHSHSLLSVANDASTSIEHLRDGRKIVREHPFACYRDELPIDNALTRLREIPEYQIHDSCQTGSIFPDVCGDMQQALAHALLQRSRDASKLLDSI